MKSEQRHADSLSVLVVDSSPGDANLAMACLREANGTHYEAGQERSLAGALAHMASTSVDVVLLNLTLSDSHGIDTLARIQKASPSVPIVVLTGADDEVSGHDAVRKGAQDYLIKGQFQASLLARVVGYAVERKRLVVAVSESEAEYRRLFESAKDGILILDPGTARITDVNQFLVDLLGFSKDEFLQKNLWEIGLVEDEEACKMLFAKLQEVGIVRYEHLPIVAKDGSTRDVEFISNSYLIGDQKRIQCNVRDISARVKADATLEDQRCQLNEERQRIADRLQHANLELEARVEARTRELQASNQELEAFAYSVSHDLRAPLRAIDGFSQILMTDYLPDLDGECEHYLKLVSANARQMGRLIDDLLRFSRVSRHALEISVVDPGALVRECLSELAPAIGSRTIDVKIEELPECHADPTVLKQVWLNLLSNAIKFTRDQPLARIEVGSLRIDGETVYHVRDNGAGFDMRYQSKLFGVFQRLHTTEEFEGTGVGLALVQRIVHRHGGRVFAEGKVDSGATFSFCLGRKNSKV